ncbi:MULTISPECIES: exosortase H [unclassified Brevundimonas]|uniref:exosortase H n=1 Tax=unclassified Brevundimonas TaxID=2622653 RepID=UPI000E8B4068|nr:MULTISPECIES: exosortase H [unclassified Brevundimonas]HBY42140.1 exosortase H [Brevundimonas sp.]
MSAAKLGAVLRSPAVQFLGLFGLIALAFFWVLATPWADKGFVQPFTQSLVSVTAWLLAPFDSRVQAIGDILRFSDGVGAVQVLAGCNAVEVCALLAAAILAYPTSLKRSLIGAALAIGALQLVNLLRIISLLYLARGSQPMFDFFHLYVWDAMIGLEALVIFFAWARLQRPAAEAAA